MLRAHRLEAATEAHLTRIDSNSFNGHYQVVIFATRAFVMALLTLAASLRPTISDERTA